MVAGYSVPSRSDPSGHPGYGGHQGDFGIGVGPFDAPTRVGRTGLGSRLLDTASAVALVPGHNAFQRLRGSRRPNRGPSWMSSRSDGRVSA